MVWMIWIHHTQENVGKLLIGPFQLGFETTTLTKKLSISKYTLAVFCKNNGEHCCDEVSQSAIMNRFSVGASRNTLALQFSILLLTISFVRFCILRSLRNTEMCSISNSGLNARAQITYSG